MSAIHCQTPSISGSKIHFSCQRFIDLASATWKLTLFGRAFNAIPASQDTFRQGRKLPEVPNKTASPRKHALTQPRCGSCTTGPRAQSILVKRYIVGTLLQAVVKIGCVSGLTFRVFHVQFSPKILMITVRRACLRCSENGEHLSNIPLSYESHTTLFKSH